MNMMISYQELVRTFPRCLVNIGLGVSCENVVLMVSSFAHFLQLQAKEVPTSGQHYIHNGFCALKHISSHQVADK